jgi:putative transposase
MPWRETSPVEQRLEFVREFETELFTMTELAAQYGISRKTGYKWLDRYDAAGALGLCDYSRRPRASPHATDPALLAMLIRLRQRHPRWGAKKLLAVAARQTPQADWPWPCPSTVAAHLKARGLVIARRRRRPPVVVPSTRGSITQANEVWTTDFKGEFLTGDRRYCYPFTLRDGFSRFILRCDALPAHTLALTRPRFERAFAEYGLPDRKRPAVWGTRLGPAVGIGGVVDSARHRPGADRSGPSRAEWIARTISCGPQSGDRAAARGHGPRATAPVHALLC